MYRNIVLALAILAAPLAAPAAAADATPRPLAHCNWGEIGCNNPPPKAAATKPGAPVPVVLPARKLAGAGQTAAACNKDLSQGDECWTNCKTEEDITICDIIKLDTFWPEAPGGSSRAGSFTGRTVQKTLGNRKVLGRVMK